MKTAETSVPVHPLLAQRWSPRAFDPVHRLGDEQVTALLEAARWAPSANNSQPWRFLVAHRGEPHFQALLGDLALGNRIWAASASVLILVAAETTDETGGQRPWALYDTGSAVAALSTQAEVEGLSVHQMGGFDAVGVQQEFGLDGTLTPVVVLAVGLRSERINLPEPLASRERAPRVRLPLDELLLAPAVAGSFAAA